MPVCRGECQSNLTGRKFFSPKIQLLHFLWDGSLSVHHGLHFMAIAMVAFSFGEANYLQAQKLSFRPLPAAIAIASSQGENNVPQEGRARAIVQSALDSLGGAQNWKGLGAATASKTIVEGPGKGTTTNMTDDWSHVQLRYKRVIRTSTGATSVVLSNGNVTTREDSKHIKHPVARGSDEQILVEYYPGLILAKALENSTCQFELIDRPNQLRLSVTTSGPAVDVIYQVCTSSSRHNSMTIVWRFLKENHRPYSVERPRIHVNGSALSEVIRFDSFISLKSVLVPNTLTITGPSGTEEKVEISDIALGKSADIDLDQESK